MVGLLQKALVLPSGISAPLDTKSVSIQDLIKVGLIKSPYGITGWVWIYSNTDPMANIFDYQPWWIKSQDKWLALSVKRWRVQSKGLVALLEGIDNRNLAEMLVGTELYIPKEALPATKSNEYYWSDLIGLKVYGFPAEVDISEQGEKPLVLFGVVTEMFETGANDVIVVQPTADSIDDAERLIPWHKTTLGAIDIPAGRMSVNWSADF